MSFIWILISINYDSFKKIFGRKKFEKCFFFLTALLMQKRTMIPWKFWKYSYQDILQNKNIRGQGKVK